MIGCLLSEGSWLLVSRRLCCSVGSCVSGDAVVVVVVWLCKCVCEGVFVEWLPLRVWPPLRPELRACDSRVCVGTWLCVCVSVHVDVVVVRGCVLSFGVVQACGLLLAGCSLFVLRQARPP